MTVKIEESWREHLKDEFAKQYFVDLTSFVKRKYKEGIVYPAPRNIFRAFDLCPFEKVKVVILGQDPYHGRDQANGLCFSVNEGVQLPPSLLNIYKEISSDVGISLDELKKKSDLLAWATQGVLLLNATLTVQAGSAGSHQGRGWEQFTDEVIRQLSEKREHVVFMLWGNYAKAKGAHIDRSRHLVLEAAHPSPFSVDNGFFGCKHFSKANKYLTDYGQTPISW